MRIDLVSLVIIGVGTIILSVTIYILFNYEELNITQYSLLIIFILLSLIIYYFAYKRIRFQEIIDHENIEMNYEDENFEDKNYEDENINYWYYFSYFHYVIIYGTGFLVLFILIYIASLELDVLSETPEFSNITIFDISILLLIGFIIMFCDYIVYGRYKMNSYIIVFDDKRKSGKNLELLHIIINNIGNMLRNNKIGYKLIKEKMGGRLLPHVTLFLLNHNDQKIRVIFYLRNREVQYIISILNKNQDRSYIDFLKQSVEKAVIPITKKYNLKIYKH